MSLARPGTAGLIAAALAVIAACDLALAVVDPEFAVTGLVDEPAHLATAAILLLAFWPAAPLPAVVACLVSAVALDLDHLPGLLEHGAVERDVRPDTHSLAAPLAALVAAALARGRARPILAGVAAGLAAHLLRDLATGPGVPLLAPLHGGSVQLPYAAYAAIMLVAGITAVLRR